MWFLLPTLFLKYNTSEYNIIYFAIISPQPKPFWDLPDIRLFLYILVYKRIMSSKLYLYSALKMFFHKNGAIQTSLLFLLLILLYNKINDIFLVEKFVHMKNSMKLQYYVQKSWKNWHAVWTPSVEVWSYDNIIVNDNIILYSFKCQRERANFIIAIFLR